MPSIYVVILILFIVIPTINNKNYMMLINFYKKRGRKAKMTENLLKEFMGKVCSIGLFSVGYSVVGKIVSLENNWIKIEEKGSIRVINGDMIKDIKLLPDKYQK